MADPSYMTVIEQLFVELNTVLNSYVFHGYTALAGYLKYPLGIAMTLYIALLGISITQGWVKLSMGNLTKSALKLALIYLAAMNWSWFSQNIVALINHASGQLGDVLIDATPMPLPHFAGEGLNGAMQSVLIEFTEIG